MKEYQKNIVNNYLLSTFNTTLDDNILEYIDGSIGKALNIINNNLTQKYKNIEKLYEIISSKDILEVLKYVSNVNFDDDLLDYLEFILYKRDKYNCIKIIENAKNRLKFNGNYDIIIDSMLLRLIDNI